MGKITRENIAEHLFEYQLNLIGKTVKDAIQVHDWKNYWKYTQEDEDKMLKYAIPLIKKVFKCNKNKALSTYEFFRANFGLRIYDK